MTNDTDTAIARYQRAHTQVYGTTPHDLRTTADGIILLHGIPLSVEELGLLAARLEAEAVSTRSHWRVHLRHLWDWLNA